MMIKIIIIKTLTTCDEKLHFVLFLFWMFSFIPTARCEPKQHKLRNHPFFLSSTHPFQPLSSKLSQSLHSSRTRQTHTDSLSDLHSWAWSRAPRRRSRWSTSRRRRWPCWWLGEESGSPLACRERRRMHWHFRLEKRTEKKKKKVPDTASEHPAERRRESRPFGGHTKGQKAAAAKEEVGRNTT